MIKNRVFATLILATYFQTLQVRGCGQPTYNRDMNYARLTMLLSNTISLC